MLNLMITAAILFSLPILLVSIPFLTANLYSKDREKNSPFECGFEPLNQARIPFSLRFFMITVIFLIFDVEISLILPVCISFEMASLISWALATFSLTIILFSGAVLEWAANSLEWKP